MGFKYCYFHLSIKTKLYFINIQQKLFLFSYIIYFIDFRQFGKNILAAYSDFGKKPPSFEDATTVADFIINCGFTFERGLIVYNKFK